MQYRRRLRSRIILSFLLFGVLLSGLFAVSVLILHDRLGDQLIGETLKKEVDDYVLQLRRNPAEREPFGSKVAGYVTPPGDADGFAPLFVRDLSSGVHEVQSGGKSYQVAVRKDPDLWVFLIQDVSSSEQLGRQLLMGLIVVLLLFSLLSLGLGVWSSRRVMAPVYDLVDRLEHLDDLSRPTKLAENFAQDEVGQLAEALDHYAERLHHLVERDREFNADVSHELRTPLAVITGATELMLAQPDLPDKLRTRLLRIARAARQSTDITAALLHLVRAEQGNMEAATAQDLDAVVDKLLPIYEPLVGNKPLELKHVRQSPVTVIAPEAVLAVTIGNLIGNALRYTTEGEVLVVVGDGRVKVRDSGPGISDEELPHVFDRHYRGSSGVGKGSGLGLAIVKRLCDIFGWRITLENQPPNGISAEIRFFADAEQD